MTVADGISFHSKREARRWGELKLLELAGTITQLRRQVRMPLGVFYDSGREAALIVDYSYVENGMIVYEDSKSGIETPESKLKRAVLKLQGITVKLTK